MVWSIYIMSSSEIFASRYMLSPNCWVEGRTRRWLAQIQGITFVKALGTADRKSINTDFCKL
jgi:hypothetical protein